MDTQTLPSRTQNTYTDEQYEAVETLVTLHNEGKTFTDTYYIVDLTGDKQVYFTLYRYRKPVEGGGMVNPYRYIKNLSIDLLQAVQEILDRATNTAVLLCADDNNNPLLTGFRKRTKEGTPTLPFGKYRGQTVAQVWDADRKYIMWFKDEYKTKPFNGRAPILNEEDRIMKDQANTLIELFWTEWREKKTEENKATSTSEFIEPLKVRQHIPVTVDKVIVRDEYTMVIMHTREGNVIYTYGHSDLEVGAQYSILGTPTKHVEKLGVKQTYFNRVKIEGKC